MSCWYMLLAINVFLRTIQIYFLVWVILRCMTSVVDSVEQHFFPLPCVISVTYIVLSIFWSHNCCFEGHWWIIRTDKYIEFYKNERFLNIYRKYFTFFLLLKNKSWKESFVSKLYFLLININYMNVQENKW